MHRCRGPPKGRCKCCASTSCKIVRVADLQPRETPFCSTVYRTACLTEASRRPVLQALVRLVLSDDHYFRARRYVEVLLGQTARTGPRPNLIPSLGSCAVIFAVRGGYTRANRLSCTSSGSAATASRTAREGREWSGRCPDGRRLALALFTRLIPIVCPILAPPLRPMCSSIAAHAIKPATAEIRMTLLIILIASTRLAL